MTAAARAGSKSSSSPAEPSRGQLVEATIASATELRRRRRAADPIRHGLTGRPKSARLEQTRKWPPGRVWGASRRTPARAGAGDDVERTGLSLGHPLAEHADARHGRRLSGRMPGRGDESLRAGARPTFRNLGRPWLTHCEPRPGARARVEAMRPEVRDCFRLPVFIPADFPEALRPDVPAESPFHVNPITRPLLCFRPVSVYTFALSSSRVGSGAERVRLACGNLLVHRRPDRDRPPLPRRGKRTLIES